MYKTIKLTKKEINNIKMAIAQIIIDMKSNEKEYDEIEFKKKISEYKKLFNYFSYIER